MRRCGAQRFANRLHGLSSTFAVKTNPYPDMKKSVYAGLVAALLCGCGHADDHDHAAEAAQPDAHEHAEGEIVFTQQQAAAAGLRTETVKAAPFAEVMKAAGRIEAPVGGETTVAATAAGLVSFAAKVRAEGSEVGRGATVAHISARDLPDGDPVDRARVAYETAREAYERGARLVGERIISQSQFEALRGQYEQARLAYEAQAADHSAGGVAVKAPAAGYVKQLLVRPGDYVAVGQPLVVLTSTRRLRLRAEVPERHLHRLASVRTARFLTPYDGRTYALDSLGGRLAARGRATGGSPYVPVTFEFDNGPAFVSGAYADVRLATARRSGVLTLPVGALTEEQGAFFVYVQADSTCYVKREVRLGETDGRRVEVKSGLKAGERVVTRGAIRVRLASAANVIPAHTHNH